MNRLMLLISVILALVAVPTLADQPLVWSEGDWQDAPRAQPLEVISVSPPLAAITAGGGSGDEQTSIVYDPVTGELGVDAPVGTELTSINIDSAGGIFTGEPAMNLGGSFDNDSDWNLFKATFGGSFGSFSFGPVAQPGLSEEVVLQDLTTVGSLAGGGDLGGVDLIYIPEPSTVVLLVLGLGFFLARRRRRHRT